MGIFGDFKKTTVKNLIVRTLTLETRFKMVKLQMIRFYFEKNL